METKDRTPWTSEKILNKFSLLQDKENYVLIEFLHIKCAKDKLTIYCKKCNNNFIVTVNNFFNNNTRCSICSWGNRWNYSKVIKEVENLDDKDNYLITNLECVKNVKSKITVNCHKCKTVFYPTCYSFFIRNTRCPICVKGNLWNRDRVKREFDLLIDRRNYTISNYENTNTSDDKITINCKLCGHIWKVTCKNFFVNKHRCNKCNSSYGEKLIASILDEFKIYYIKEHTFKDCVYKNRLRIDFYIPTYKLFIEFHGEHHFVINNRFKMNKYKLELVKHKDKIKRQYALNNGYNFLEIHYDEIPWMKQMIYAYLSTLIIME